MSDECSLLQRVGRREDGATEAMIDRYGNLVWSIVRKFSFNRTDSEDAAQEIFIELWRHAPRFDPDVAAETTFVAMIARRRMIDRVRKQKRQPQLSSTDQHEPTEDPSAVRVGESGDQAEASIRAFERLRPEQQQVLKLAIHHGQSHEQIASSTGLPLGTVKTHARRGLLRLRELLDATKTAASPGGVVGGVS